MMVDDVVLQATNASKKFCRSLKHVMLYGAQDIARNAVGIRSQSETLRDGEFWAVDDVSFELKKGEVLGIIGPNGSGKSTMLKMLNGIFMPDKGKIEIKGKVGALIEVGAGFHPMLTGRENIYINGSILGMTKKEIDKEFDEIVGFADIGDFIDAPVKHYSSGMYVRLGFAVAVHCTPEILLVDEILSVGDLNFQYKSIEKIKSLREKGITIIFVSHNLLHVASFCKSTIFLNGGKVEFIGNSNETIQRYRANSVKKIENKNNKVSIKKNIGIKNMRICDKNGEIKNDSLTFAGEYVFEVSIHVPNDFKGKKIHIHIILLNIITRNPVSLTTKTSKPIVLDGDIKVMFKISKLRLADGCYSITCFVSGEEHLYDYDIFCYGNVCIDSGFNISENFGTYIVEDDYWIEKEELGVCT